MKTSFIRAMTRWRRSLSLMVLSASVCGLGCASIGRKIDQTIAPVFSGQPAPDARSTTTTTAKEAVKAETSANAAIGHEKFNAMLQENGLSK
jgi:hypothetical protein